MPNIPTASKSLGKVAWRRIEQPTFPLRMRAACNQIKSKLLAEKHDPFKIQTASFTRNGLAPVTDELTWKRWWEGNSVPMAEQIAACEKIFSGVQHWILSSERGMPIQRHMVALDAVGVELTRDNEWWRKKAELQASCLHTLNKVWSKFTEPTCERIGTTLSFEKQILTGEFPSPTFRHASIEERIFVETHYSNPYPYEFTKETRLKYVSSDKFGLFEFFQAVMRETKLQQLWLKDTWVMDMATLVALMRVDLIDTPKHFASGFGRNMEVFAFWYRLFWNTEAGAESLLFGLTEKLEENEKRERTEFFLGIRRRYYEMLNELGISFDDIFKIAGTDFDETENTP